MKKHARQIVDTGFCGSQKVERNWLFELLSVANNQFSRVMRITGKQRILVHRRMIGAIESREYRQIKAIS